MPRPLPERASDAYPVLLLDEKRMPYHKVGTHRRVLFKDLIAYRVEHRRARGAALDDMTRPSEELGPS